MDNVCTRRMNSTDNWCQHMEDGIKCPASDYTVTFIRGPKATRTYEHTTFRAARIRADALAELHNVDYTEDGDSLTVDASEFYYASARRKLRRALDPEGKSPTKETS